MPDTFCIGYQQMTLAGKELTCCLFSKTLTYLITLKIVLAALASWLDVGDFILSKA